MSDDLVKRLWLHDCEGITREAADRIEELEAKLAKAVWRLEQMQIDRTGYRHPSHYIRGAAVTLAELKGDKP